ncbi:MAG: hypothetical protein LQ347_003876 [Umbilicaria vellea]|nr:MAG: hypothetical protein LQ347_003876 [Umbilicaria vellea]
MKKAMRIIQIINEMTVSETIKDLDLKETAMITYYDETENNQFKKYENDYYNNDQFKQKDD